MVSRHKLTISYIEGWKGTIYMSEGILMVVINLANEVFGFNGWNSSIVSLTTDFVSFMGEEEADGSTT